MPAFSNGHAAVVLLGLLFAACHGNTVGDSSGDAATDSVSDTVTDAAAESIADSAGDSTAGTDVGDATETTPTPAFCAGSVHAYCNDFDTSTAAADGWTGSDFKEGGGTIDTTWVKSKPNSFLSQILASTSGEVAGSLFLDLPAPAPDRVIRAEVSLYLPAPYAGNAVLLLKIGRGGGGVDATLGGAGDSGGTPLALNVQSTASKNAPASKPLAIGVWQRIRLEVLMSTTTSGYARLYVDDISVASVVSFATTVVATATTTRFHVGLYTNYPSSAAMRAHFDNVFFDFL